jgi:hypothetical protein
MRVAMRAQFRASVSYTRDRRRARRDESNSPRPAGQGVIAMASDYEVEEADHDILIVNHPNYLIVHDGTIVAYCEDKGIAYAIADALNLVRKMGDPTDNQSEG